MIVDRAIAQELIASPGAFRVDLKNPRLLVSKRLSPYYVNCRVIPSFHPVWNQFTDVLVTEIKKQVGREIDKIGTTATAGIPFAALVSHKLGVGMVYVRQETKRHGLETRMEGVLSANDYVVGVDDLTTTAKTAHVCVEEIRRRRGSIDSYFVVFDRNEGARESLEKEGVNLKSLVRMEEDFIQFLTKESSIGEKELSELRTYILNPRAWSRSFIRANPEYLLKKLEVDNQGFLLSEDVLEVFTDQDAHPELMEEFKPLVEARLLDLGVKKDYPKFDYTRVTSHDEN